MALSDGIHVAGTLARAGCCGPLARIARCGRSWACTASGRRWLPASWAAQPASRTPPAVIDDDGSVTFAELERRTNALARGLAGHGLTEGRTLAVMCRNHRGFVEVAAACSKLGVHVVLLNTGFAGPQVAEVVEREGADGLVYDREFAATVRRGARRPRLFRCRRRRGRR